MIETENNNISEALWDYLDAIYRLSLDKSSVRITDIARYLDISKPSVNRAVNSLKSAGLVSHEPYGDIILTPRGLEKGGECYRRRKTIARFFTSALNLEDEVAEYEAGRIEHGLSSLTVDKMSVYINN